MADFYKISIVPAGDAVQDLPVTVPLLQWRGRVVLTPAMAMPACGFGA